MFATYTPSYVSSKPHDDSRPRRRWGLPQQQHMGRFVMYRYTSVAAPANTAAKDTRIAARHAVWQCRAARGPSPESQEFASKSWHTKPGAGMTVLPLACTGMHRLHESHQPQPSQHAREVV